MPTTIDLLNNLKSSLKSGSPRLGSDESLKNEFWATGLLPIDAVLGGGFQKGRMALLTGEHATLKSMIGYAAIKSVQAAGGTAALIDSEHAFNTEWAEHLGINTSDLIIERPETGEYAVDAMEVLVRNGIDYICLDSIASLLPKSERELMLSGKDNPQPARIAALMAIALRKLNTANERTSIVWISQLRDNLGAMAFSPKTVVTGGKSIHYYVSQSLQLKKVGKITRDVRYFNGEKDAIDKQTIGQMFKAELLKARNTQPFQTQYFNFDLEYGEIDLAQYLIQQGLDMGIVERPSSITWQLNIVDDNGEIIREDKAKGKDGFKELVATNVDIRNDLAAAIAKRYKLDGEVYKV